jgi:predicted nucleotidyltransferase
VDKESLLRSLNDHGVEYVVIGAAAFPVHGYARATLDIDIFIRPEPENAARTLAALRAFGYDVTDLSAGDLLTHKVLIRQYVVELDVHPFVRGASFEAVWQDRVLGSFGAVPVTYASLDHLIAMKRAAGRPKDLEDLRALERLRARKP